MINPNVLEEQLNGMLSTWGEWVIRRLSCMASLHEPSIWEEMGHAWLRGSLHDYHGQCSSWIMLLLFCFACC